jgi:hypothetical protein
MAHRQSYFLRLRTWLVLAGVAAALGVYNVRGWGGLPPSDARGQDLAARYLDATWKHGLPLPYMSQRCFDTTLFEYPYEVSPWPKLRRFGGIPLPFVTGFDPAVLAIDFLFAVGVLACVGWVTERWLRRPRRRFQYSLRTLLSLPLGVATFFAFWRLSPGFREMLSENQPATSALLGVLLAFLLYAAGCLIYSGRALWVRATGFASAGGSVDVSPCSGQEWRPAESSGGLS